MLTAREPASPSDGEPAEIRPAAPLTSIHRSESPAAADADAAPADAAPADAAPADAALRNPAPSPGGAAGTADEEQSGRNRPANDRQTSSGVPATPIVSPAPMTDEVTQRLTRPPAGDAETTQRLTPPPSVRAGPGEVRSGPGEVRRRLTPPAPGRPDDDTQVLFLSFDPTPADRPGDPEAVTAENPVVARPAAPAAPVVRNTAAEALTVELRAVELRAVDAPPAAAPATAHPDATPPASAAPARRAGADRRHGVDLGRAPAVLAVSSIGVLLVALAYADGRDGIEGALTLYWIGQVVVFTPVAARLLWRRAAGTVESFLLVMGLAVNQYLLKWTYSPDQFRFPDELQHWLATTVLLRTDALFRPNPALPPAVHFPGLAEMGAAVADLTGLSVTAAGMLVAGLAHLLFVAALFVLVLRISGSPAVAGVTCVVYATALHYLFFNSMYLYATGALPFLMVAVWAVQRWRSGGGRPFAVVAVIGMVAATATHHVTAFMLAASLTLVGVAEFVLAGRPRRWSAFAMPIAAFAVVAGWIVIVAPDVVAYLQAPFDEALHTVAVLLDGKPVEGTATTAAVSPVQLAVQGTGLLMLFALYLGVGVDMRRRRERDAWRWAALIGGGIFFAGNGVRFLGQNGPEIAGRLNTFTYVPVSIVAGIALTQVTRLIPRRAVQVAVAAAGVTLLMVGARMGGWPPSWGLLPGPYLVAGYERSVDAAGTAAADWQRTALGPGHRVAGDVTAVALSSTYGMQDPVRESAPLFYADVWTAGSDRVVQDLAIEYLVVDRRLATDLPALDAYFEHDPLAGRHTRPMSAGQLAKFDDVPQLDRLYDNGDIRIYRTGVRR